MNAKEIQEKLAGLEKTQQIAVMLGAITKSMDAEQEIRFQKALAELFGGKYE